MSKYQYPIEKHTVISTQGYILTLYRLPFGRKSKVQDSQRPVALVHVGLFGSPESFLFRGPEHGLRM